MTLSLGSNSFSIIFVINEKFVAGISFFKISESRPCFLIKVKMIADLQDAGKLPDRETKNMLCAYP